MKAISWSSFVSTASSEALNVKEANAVPIDLDNDGSIGACVVVDVDGEAVAAAEAATAGEAAALADGNSGAFAISTSIGSDENAAAVVGEGSDDGDGKGEMVPSSVDNFPLGLTGVSMVGGLLGAVALLAGVRPICQ